VPDIGSSGMCFLTSSSSDSLPRSASSTMEAATNSSTHRADVEHRRRRDGNGPLELRHAVAVLIEQAASRADAKRAAGGSVLS